MARKDDESGIDANNLSKDVAMDTTGQIWLWGLLDQAEKHDGKVTITIPSLGIEKTLTTKDLQAAQEKINQRASERRAVLKSRLNPKS